MDRTPIVIDLGEPRGGFRFDSAFDVARTVRDTFHCDVVTFVHNGTLVRVEQFTTASEAFEQWHNAREATR